MGKGSRDRVVESNVHHLSSDEVCQTVFVHYRDLIEGDGLFFYRYKVLDVANISRAKVAKVKGFCADDVYRRSVPVTLSDNAKGQDDKDSDDNGSEGVGD